MNFLKQSEKTHNVDLDFDSKILESFIYVINMQEIMLKLTVHEDIGRYPVILDDGKTTTELYSEKQDQLKKLMDEVQMINSEIKNQIKK